MGRKNVKAKENEGKGSSSPADPLAAALAASLPRLLWELQSLVLGDGTTPRRPLGLSIFYQDGTLKACVRDRDMGRVAFLSASTVAELLFKVDRGLEDHSLDWRVDKFASQAPRLT